jgi:hypothetical protein
VISCELVLLSIVVNYIGYVFLYVVCCILLVLEAPRPGRQPKQVVVKNPYIHHLADEYKGHASAAGATLEPHIFVS